MRQDDRAPFVEALESARVSAYADGEFVGQESFMRAGEILALADAAGVRPGVRVLDLCCGIAGPGRYLTAQRGCDYLGIDYSAGAIGIARAHAEAAGLACRFEVAQVPPIPPAVGSPGPDVVLLLETLLAFEDKTALLAEVSRVLATGGRFAFTLEEGAPLSPAERLAMPDADTVWLETLPAVTGMLEHAGFRITWQSECSEAHRAMADALLTAFGAHGDAIAAQVGRTALEELVAAHRLWRDWIASGRVRKFALVAQKLT
jgi:sarcosine/dimethylglycine N-methyltransferase